MAFGEAMARMPRSKQYGWVICLGLLLGTNASQAQTTLDQQEQRERAQREAQARQQQQATPDVRLGGETGAPDFHRIDLPRETPCFQIHSVHLAGAQQQAFAFAQRYLDRYAGRCIGAQGVAQIVRRVSDLVIDRGYVTTRIGVTQQDLSSGVLSLNVVAGTIRAIRRADGTPLGAWQTALPARPGDLLNLRDIEQGLEQFKRVASQDVSIDIAPGERAGQSDLVITAKRSRPWHVVATLDDSGSQATGKDQAGLNVTFDNPLALNDTLTVGVNHNLWRSNGHGSSGQQVSYSVPYGHWLFTAATSGYRYHQTIAGYQTTFLSRGKSRNADLTAQRVIHRSPSGKTALELRIGKRWAHSFIENVEIASQRRDTTMAELALVQRQYLGTAQLDLRLAQRWGVPWLGGQGDVSGWPGDAPTYRYTVSMLDATVALPFKLARWPLQWTSELHAQRSPDTLYASEFITLGGRFTIRGFDGQQTLAAEHGWTWRNTLSAPLGHWPASAYLGIDMGHIGGPSQQNNGTQRSLRGGVLGLRGNVWGLGWDVFAGWALEGGRALDTVRPATGFSLIYAL